MKTNPLLAGLSLVVALALNSGCVTSGGGGSSDSRAALDSKAKTALKQLHATNPSAAALGKQAKAVLVFPAVLKGGFMIGAQSGNGVLLQNGHPAGYFNLTAASYGFQAGLQSFGYALFLMNDKAMQ